MKKIYIKKCIKCGREFETMHAKARYCSEECKADAQEIRDSQKNEERKRQRAADKGMKKIEKGMLDKRLAEARRKGISYAELQKQKTLELIRKGEL